MKTRSAAPRARQVAAAVIGNALEWYDFVVFGALTVIIGNLFFPGDTELNRILKATATFGVGFFMRPIGGIVLGIYADRHGRKAALQLIIGLMTLAMAMIACAPPYAAIGIAAPLIVVLARLLQGFATGGEFAIATSFLVEVAPPGRKGLYGSLQQVGLSLAALGGALAGWFVTQVLTPAQLDSWGWRLPFAVGLLIGPVGMWVRRHLEETEEFERARAATGTDLPLPAMLRSHARSVLVTFGLIICGTITYYVVLIYMPTFAGTQLGIPLEDAFTAQVIALLCLTAVIPAVGALSDRVGRKPPMIVGSVACLLALQPLFERLHAQPDLPTLIATQASLCTLIGIFYGPLSTAVAEQFPAGVRSTALSLAYNLAVMLFGGFAQFFVTWLIGVTGQPIAAAYYVMFGATVGLLATLALRTHR
ncbi:MAG TPA: MFS transporter [Gammaproteobacteria bacterium]|nr:MFS transporter [Gammaproteobacteria bacterium]